MPGRPPVEHALAGLPCSARRASIFVARSVCALVHGARHACRSTAAIAALSRRRAAGATETARRPRVQEQRQQRGSPPASPQRLTSRPPRAPMRDDPAIEPQHRRDAPGPRGRRRDGLSRAAAVTYWVRSFEPIEKKAASKRSTRDRGRRHLDHDAERRARVRQAFGRRAPPAPRRGARGVAAISSGTVTIGSMIFTRPCAAARASARSCTRKTSGRASDRRMPRRPRNGFDLASIVRPGDRLVAAGIERADGDRPAAAHSAMRR